MPTTLAVHLHDEVTDGRRTVTLVPSGATPPDDTTDLGDLVIENLVSDNQTLFHGVRDFLYHEGIYDMQRVDIVYDNEVLIVNFDLSETSVTVEEGATATVAVYIKPGHANVGTLTAVSAAIGTATVSVNNGTKVITITGVAAGSTTVTATINGVNHVIEVTVVVEDTP